MKTPTIYDVKYDTQEDAPFMFARDTMRGFGQILKDFHVDKTDNDHVFHVWALSRMSFGTMKTERYYVPSNDGCGGMLLTCYDDACIVADARFGK